MVGDAMRDAPAPVVCGPAYQPVAGQTSRYRTGITGAFAEAEAACEADGGHLIVVDDAVEDAYAASFGQGWIGISDTAVEGVFRGVTGTALGYINYAAGEPNSTGSDEDCLETTGTGWNDLPCRLPRIGACECDGVAATSGAWCDTDLAATCGDCSTTCADLQVCTNQTCIF